MSGAFGFPWCQERRPGQPRAR